jgi:hypothetical protein
MGTYWIQKDHAFVHDLKVTCYGEEVVVELAEKVCNLWTFDLNNERVWQFGVLG